MTGFIVDSDLIGGSGFRAGLHWTSFGHGPNQAFASLNGLIGVAFEPRQAMTGPLQTSESLAQGLKQDKLDLKQKEDPESYQLSRSSKGQLPDAPYKQMVADLTG